MTDTTEAPPYLFGVSQYTTWHWSFEEDLRGYAELGAQAIEICEFKLKKEGYDAQLAQVQEHGLTITSVQPEVHTLYPDTLAHTPADPRARMDLVRHAIEHIAPYAPPGTPFVVNTGVAPNGNFREGWDTAVREFRALSDFAADHGMRIALEPLNPILMNENTFVWLIPQVLEMANQIDRENFGVCLDTWNDWQDPQVTEHIASCGERAFVVQVSDWHLPRGFSDRAIIGQGEIPTATLLRAIHESGYRGAYTLEIFSADSLPDSLWKADGREVIRQSKAGLDKAWQDAFAQ